MPDDAPTLVEFLYLSKERYRFDPETAAGEVFQNRLYSGEEPACVAAIRRALQKEQVLENESALWREDEVRDYLERFIERFDQLSERRDGDQ